MVHDEGAPKDVCCCNININSLEGRTRMPDESWVRTADPGKAPEMVTALIENWRGIKRENAAHSTSGVTGS